MVYDQEASPIVRKDHVVLVQRGILLRGTVNATRHEQNCHILGITLEDGRLVRMKTYASFPKFDNILLIESSYE